MKTVCSCGGECMNCKECDSPKCECFCDLYDDDEDEQNYRKDNYM